MYVLVLLLGHLLVDGDEEVLQVVGQPSVTLARVFADECLLARLGVNGLVAPSALTTVERCFCFAIAAQVAVAFGEPPLEAVEAELLASREVDEDVTAFRFATLISNVLVDADVLARAGELYAVDALAVHHVGIRPVALAFGIDFERLLTLHGDAKRIRGAGGKGRGARGLNGVLVFSCPLLLAPCSLLFGRGLNE